MVIVFTVTGRALRVLRSHLGHSQVHHEKRFRVPRGALEKGSGRPKSPSDIILVTVTIRVTRQVGGG